MLLSRLRHSVIVVAALSAVTLSAQQAHSAARLAPTSSNPDAGINQQTQSRVISNLEARNFAAALVGARTILTNNPQSPRANKLVGVILLDQNKATAALPYFNIALRLSPNDPTINALLLQAYAESGDKLHRDQQRAILRSYHDDGKHPVFAQIPSFLIETIPVGDKTIQAAEFYQPSGQYHFYYRFNVFDASGHMQSFFALESGDTDQPLFAHQFPKLAAAGQRRFSLDGYARSADGKISQALYTFFNREPDYDNVRNLIVKLVQEGKEPVSAPATAGSINLPATKSKPE